MLKLITNMQISRRLLLAFLLAAVIPGIVISVLGFTFDKEQNNRSRAFQTNINAYKMCTNASNYLPWLKELLSDAYQDQYETANPALQAQAKNAISQLQQVQGQFDTAIKTYQQQYEVLTSAQMSNVRSILFNHDPNTQLAAQQQGTLDQIMNTLWPDYQAAQDRYIAAINAKAPSTQVDPLKQQVLENYTALANEWEQVEQITEQLGNTVATIGPAETNPLILATLVAFLSTIILVTAIGYVVYLTITRPLRQLALLTRRIAHGETHARAMIIGHDEIYLVAQSMNNMLDHIVQLIRDTQRQRDMLQAQVEKLVSEVSGVGEGDLRVQAEVTGDALGVLADSFNYMVEALGSLVVRVKTVSAEVDRWTVVIQERMAHLVETGNKQLQQIADAEAQIELMTLSNRQVAERSQVLYNVARVARQDAQIGRESVLHAIEGMGHINENVQDTANKVLSLGERSREINDIVEAISGIAYQTNRLALDAAIQAAMAGEHGKGFGAVAADIRRLAERSKDQANMITRIVRSVREEISAVAASMQDTERETATGALLTHDAGTALESIFAAVEHQAREIETINQVAMKQLQSSSAIVHIMQGVSESTRLSSQSTQEASKHMSRLARLVEQLRTSVEVFKLRENRDYAIPHTNMNPLTNDTDTPLTVSGIFRKISAANQAAQTSRLGKNDATRTPAPEPAGHYTQFAPLPSTRTQPDEP